MNPMEDHPLQRLVDMTHELGLYDDCPECRRTGGHENRGG